MKNHERIWTALNHEEPDRVPTFTQTIEPGFVQKYDEEVEVDDDYGFPLGRFQLMVAKSLGLDSMWVHAGNVKSPRDLPETPELPEGLAVDRYGHVSTVDRTSGHRWYTDGILKTPELIRDWIEFLKEFEPADEEYYRSFAREVWEHGCERADFVPIPTAGGPIYIAWASIGLDRIALLMRKHAVVVAELFKAWGEVTKEEHKCFFEQGIDMIFTCDDHAFKDRLMFSRAQYDRFIYPVYKALADNAHRHGAKFIVHTDGYLEEAFPGMVRAGVDGVDPLEYEAGNRLGPLKEAYGDDITLIGNVPATWALCTGTVEDTVKVTRQCLEDAMEGGGYMLGPGSDMLACSKIENVRAMVETVKMYGRYSPR
ncbi:MAG: uroporphyrinogen decarboxylase family protein [Promethearchaeota archaeon]